MSRYAEIEKRFKETTQQHTMEVVREDGVHRHLRFRRPGTYAHGFDIVTWPGHLAISGDMGAAVFARLPDMFEFFRPDVSRKSGDQLFINAGYWAEKCVANDGEKQEFSPALFRNLVKERFDEFVNERHDDEEPHAVWVAALWADLNAEVLFEDSYEGAVGRAIERMSEFEPMEDGYRDFRFHDAWEYGSCLQDYTFHFIWRLYAIAYAVKTYDETAGAILSEATTNG